MSRVAPHVVVWGSLVALTTYLVRGIVRNDRNVALFEDWLLVPSLAGRQPLSLPWLWAQNNEHRSPLARLALFVVLRLSHDFRSAMVLNVIVLVLATVVLVVALARRRGRLLVADAFIPLVLLHLGHSENLYWPFEHTIVQPILPLAVFLAVIACAKFPLTPRMAIVLSVSATLLPLGGGTTLPVAPLAVIALVLIGRDRSVGTVARRILWSGAAVTSAVLAFYFIGWIRPTWPPPNPGIAPSLTTFGRAIALGWGPATKTLWNLAVPATVCLLGVTAVFLGKALGRPDAGTSRSTDVIFGTHRRAMALTCYMAGTVGVAFAFAVGRTGWVATAGYPGRYALTTAPVLVGAYVCLDQFARGKLRVTLLATMCLVAVLLLPGNARAGRNWQRFADDGSRSLIADIDQGRTVDAIVDRNADRLLPWSHLQMWWGIETLRTAGVRPFDRVPAPTGPPQINQGVQKP